ncbi:LOW QUALITY PROTEIN: hypothetical protein Cgig2_008657 [Carnegiea gigantea]|uniref:Uncharacterized protein n=1 Tax=Carnegiea gigantea TaxID=171969 RepID=A0A9Q1GSF2_9CARY|nr:LOW QUALITY PROTEIN: hypothetical protein Cgig2_008657 [Carnegiea gigantea]
MVEIFLESKRRIYDMHYNKNFNNDYPVEHWARYTFDPELKCHGNTINFIESFNSKIEKYIYKTIFSLLEAVRRKFMQIIANRSVISKDWKGKVVPRIGPPLIDIKRDRPQTKRRRDITERRKVVRSITLKCSNYKQFYHNKRSHKIDAVLEILNGKDRPSYKEKQGNRKVGRPRKEEPLAKKSKTSHQHSSSQAGSQASSSKESSQPFSSKKKKNQISLTPQRNQVFLLPLKKHL